MSDESVARGLGWFSVAVGLAFLVAPRRLARLFGMGDRPGLSRYLGVRDVLVGAGLLGWKSPAPWVWGRASADASDAVMMGWGILSGRFSRGPAAVVLVGAAGLSAYSALLARRLSRP